MNFLAHLYLSGKNEEVMLGNFMADAVKGKQAAAFSEGIQKGIALHRAIDTYTDSHPVVTEIKDLMRPVMGKYSPVVADVFLDHFLAVDWENHHHQSLDEYVAETYTFLQANTHLLPARTAGMLPYMVQHNWLLAYRHIAGIATVMTQMGRRAKFENKMHLSGEELERNYSHYAKGFAAFFPGLMKHAEERL
ncbi:MAG: DUF479 domain-containing protein [Flavobacteriaceae bacterium]|nr:DUF479 domain-containing protein [Flavobacteriaceae bacterium]